MTSARQIASNRINARASTGPKTASGKARASRNAKRHGLSLPILHDPAWSVEIDALATTLAGERAAPSIITLARRVAEPTLDLVRIGQARFAAIADAFQEGLAFENLTLAAADSDKAPPSCVRKFSDRDGRLDVVDPLTKKLKSFSRFERRAVSRRKFAIRALDVALRNRSTSETIA